VPITLGSNIASLAAQRRLGEHSSQVSSVFERLSSGLRVNRASDDPAGLSMALRLRADSRIQLQAQRNVNDGTSMLNIAEGTLQELSNISTRILELAEQSANGVYSSSQRRALNAEAQALASEMTRITNTTTFNGISLLEATQQSFSIQVGKDSSASARISLLLQSPLARLVGDGTFQAESTISTAGLFGSPYANQLAGGDLNRDGYVDILSKTSNGNLAVILSNGDGTFKTATDSVTAYTYSNRRIGIADINGDGNLDFTGLTGAGNFGVRLGNGDGTFKADVSYVITPAVTGNGVTLGDFNGDGKVDVVVGDPTNTKLAIALGNGDGSFKAAVSYTATSTSIRDTAAGDVNGDGRLDIIATGNLSVSEVWIGNGDGSFALGVTFTNSIAQRSPSLIDLNDDGYLDLVGGTTGSAVGVLLGNGNGTFKASTNYTVGSSNANNDYIRTGDFNGDGIPDIVSSDSVSGTISILLNNGNGTFAAAQSYVASSAGDSVLVADFDADGVSDIASASQANQVIGVFFGNGEEQNSPPLFSLLSASDARSALSAFGSVLDSISQSLGEVGAQQSRLLVASAVIQSSADAYSTAAGRIMDADLAADAAELVRLQILQQATVAVLASANLQPQIAIRLLRDS
jgi:flagellin-like hook-associated protein FlgL